MEGAGVASTSRKIRLSYVLHQRTYPRHETEYDINHTAFAMCDAHFKGRDVHLHSSHNMMRTHNYMHHIISILRMNENQFNPPRSLFCESRTQ